MKHNIKKNRNIKDSQRNKEKSLKSKGFNITIDFVAFAFLAVYLIGFSVSSFNKPQINTEVVAYGQIDSPKEFDGVITRSEEVTYANEEGRAFFFYRENEYVKKDSVVCAIRDAESARRLENEIAKLNDDILSHQSQINGEISENEEVKRLNSKMKAQVNIVIPKLLNCNGNDLYSFKYQLQKDIDGRNQIILSGETGESIPESLEDQKNAYEKQLNNSIASYKAQSGGILSYNIDGMEEIYTVQGIEHLTPSQIKNEAVGSGRLTADKQVKNGEPIFKIVNSNVWYISAYLDNSLIYGWEEGMGKYLYIKEEDKTKKILMKVESFSAGYEKTYVIFSSSGYMLDFIDKRTVSFCLDDDSFKGMKVPNTAIADKTALEIPTVYISEFKGVTGVYVRVENDYKFKPVHVISGNSEITYVIQDFENVKLGMMVYNKTSDGNIDENDSFTISNIQTTTGIYVANSGTAEFKQVEILSSNEFYSIIKKGTLYGVKPYDVIITYASAVKNNQIIR